MSVDYTVKFPKSALFSGQGRAVVLKIAVRSLEETGVWMWQAAQANAPYYTGNLKRSIKSERVSTPLGIRIHPYANYAFGVERGTPPHIVPLEDLQRWAKLKFQISESRAYGAATVIQRNIAKHGTKAKKYMERAFVENKDRVLATFGAAGREIANELSKY